MLNQAYSDLVVLKATEDLLLEHPSKKFLLYMGALNGFDICSTFNEVIAECFAVVLALNNQKIKKNSDKLIKPPDCIKKYIYISFREKIRIV